MGVCKSSVKGVQRRSERVCEFSVAHAKDSSKIICPCLECCYGAVSAEHLQDHLVCNGIDESYTCWTMHGEEEIEPVDS